MPYFFVVQAFVMATLVMAAAALLCAFVSRLRWAYPFAWRMLVWSSVGCVVVNLPVLALYLVPLAFDRAGISLNSGGSGSALNIVLAVGLLIGPVVASAAGYIGGVLLGYYLALRAASRAS